MTAKKPKIKIVFRHGKLLTKVVLLITIVLCTVALIAIHSVMESEKARLDLARAAAFKQEQERDDVQGKIDRLGSQDGIVEIAGDELGLYDPDTVIVETE